MSYVIKAVLSSRNTGDQVTIPFPIPDQEYDHTIELLDGLGLGDALEQDCQIDEVDSWYDVPQSLKGTNINVDELDYLAKRLDSFCDNEAEQFQAMAHKLDLHTIKDFINLTFCCQQATVISDFSKLEQAGLDHRMNLNGGCMTAEESKTLDGRKEALQLIATGKGTVTPYGVVYDNGMELRQLYNGRHFPPYYYDVSVAAVEVVSAQKGTTGLICLPASEQQLQRQCLRAEVGAPASWLRLDMDALRDKSRGSQAPLRPVNTAPQSGSGDGYAGVCFLLLGSDRGSVFSESPLLRGFERFLAGISRKFAGILPQEGKQ